MKWNEKTLARIEERTIQEQGYGKQKMEIDVASKSLKTLVDNEARSRTGVPP